MEDRGPIFLEDCISEIAVIFRERCLWILSWLESGWWFTSQRGRIRIYNCKFSKVNAFRKEELRSRAWKKPVWSLVKLRGKWRPLLLGPTWEKIAPISCFCVSETTIYSMWASQATTFYVCGQRHFHVVSIDVHHPGMQLTFKFWEDFFICFGTLPRFVHHYRKWCYWLPCWPQILNRQRKTYLSPPFIAVPLWVTIYVDARISCTTYSSTFISAYLHFWNTYYVYYKLLFFFFICKF